MNNLGEVQSPDSAALKGAIQDLFADFTLEVVPGSAAKIERFDEHVHPGTPVYVTFLPGADFNDTLNVAKRIAGEGLVPIPHFAARSIPNRPFFEDALKAVRDETGSDRALAIAGGLSKPLGDYSDSMQLLETGLFDKYGFKQIGLAGHPEGSPDMSGDAIWDAVDWKNGFQNQTDARLYIVTQFAFEADPIIAWDHALTERGNQLPVYIGLPGIATIKTLLKLAQASGVGPSLRFITRQARNVAKLLTVQAPDKLVTDLAIHRLTTAATNIGGVHVYPLGGMRRSALWAYAVANGDIDFKNDGGFTAQVEF